MSGSRDPGERALRYPKLYSVPDAANNKLQKVCGIVRHRCSGDGLADPPDVVSAPKRTG